MGAVLVDSVRGAYEHSEYLRAIATGTQVLSLFQSPKNSDSRAYLLELIGKSNWRLAVSANTDPKQADEWDRNAVSSIEESSM